MENENIFWSSDPPMDPLESFEWWFLLAEMGIGILFFWCQKKFPSYFLGWDGIFFFFFQRPPSYVLSFFRLLNICTWIFSQDSFEMCCFLGHFGIFAFFWNCHQSVQNQEVPNFCRSSNCQSSHLDCRTSMEFHAFWNPIHLHFTFGVLDGMLYANAYYYLICEHEIPQEDRAACVFIGEFYADLGMIGIFQLVLIRQCYC